MNSSILETLSNAKREAIESEAHEKFGQLIQEDQYVGDVYSLSYQKSLVLIHDFHRKRVGGIPSLSFLIATRVTSNKAIDFTKEDSSIILLRVMDSAPLPNDSEAQRIRVEAAQRISGKTTHWDEAGSMDGSTANLLSFAGISCTVIGTFFLQKMKPDDEEDIRLRWKFGDDISNYYPNQGLKVYKPNDFALKNIVNHREVAPDEVATPFEIGEVRYASTNRSFQGVSNVEVEMIPEDFLSQKTAIFGMTRTGKSNTTKVLLQAVFLLRASSPTRRIGQLVFDPNGEYANENVQDASDGKSNAIKNVWKTYVMGQESDVVTYGISPHPNDPKRNLMLLNFYLDENLQIGKEIIDNALMAESSSLYLNNFRQIVFDPPSPNDRSAITRYNRRVLAYRSLLAKAGYKTPNSIQANPTGLFNSMLLQTMQQSDDPEVLSAASHFSSTNASWSQLAKAFQTLEKFLNTDEYKDFERRYISRPNSSGDPWADDDLKKILTMFAYPNGSRLIGKVRPQHSHTTTEDYAKEIYNHLVAGRLVIVDQASGDLLLNQASAKRIMQYIFDQNQQKFRQGEEPPSLLLYVEEAHNLLPAGSDLDLSDIWVRTAKEGAKYKLGMVYATQEVSSIQKNILKNTSNWFIGHLNNTDETRELIKYYDFADFEKSIRRAQDKGFLRIKTLSNRYVIPVQVKRFEVQV